MLAYMSCMLAYMSSMLAYMSSMLAYMSSMLADMSSMLAYMSLYVSMLCVTGPTRSARHFRRRMRHFLQSPCEFKTKLTDETHAVKSFHVRDVTHTHPVWPAL